MFFSSKISANSLLQNLTDCHTHILPGVDDGVKSIEESLEILSYYEDQGVRRVVFTPHVMEDLPLNNAQFLRKEFERFQLSYNGGIELSLAAEYMLDGGFEKHLKSGDLLTFYDNYLLVELSCVDMVIDLSSLISSIMSSGYFVVLAHPERYLYLSRDRYREIADMGVLFQLNIPSILGSYGKGVRRRAEQLLACSMYSVIGSDIHSFSYHSKVLANTKITKRVFEQIKGIGG